MSLGEGSLGDRILGTNTNIYASRILADYQLSWASHANTTKDFNVSWEIPLKIQLDMTISFSVISKVILELDVSWSYLVNVSNDISILWEVDAIETSETIAVGNRFVLPPTERTVLFEI